MRQSGDGAEPCRAAAQVPVAESGLWASRWPRGPVEDPLTELDEEEVDDDHGGHGGEEGGRQGLEAEDGGQGGGRQGGAEGDDTQCRRRQGEAGRLRRNGVRRVRMAKITRVRGAGEFTNQPVWKTHSVTAKVTKSDSEPIGPEHIVKRRMKPSVTRSGAGCGQPV
ncbi:hypothetical protein [Streptomyces sp. NPDC001292]|uniref:hypothetical protein n=1 Tax=Streptomyces sp. NPDC001292 TaxID=3364558 RepID=UPI00368C6AB2